MVVKVAGLALALAVFVARPALADEATFRLSWVRGDGAGSCPDGRALATRAAERLGRDPFSEAAEQSIEGSVAREGGELIAELRVRDAGGVARGSREIRSRATDCSELADAVVLAVVLAIDPNAALERPNAAAPPSEPVAQPPMASPPAFGACPVARCPAPAPCPAARCPEPPFASAALAARFVAALGILPGFAPGVAVAGELGGARVRGTLGAIFFPEVTADSDRYAFGLTTGSLGAILAWPLPERFELGLLGEVEAGAIHAVVFELEPVEPGDRLWLAGAFGPRLGFSGFAPLRLELGASLVVPFVRPSFEVRGIAEPVFQSAPLGGLAYLGAGVGVP